MKVSSLPLAVSPLVLGALFLAAPRSGQSQCCPPIITTQPTNQLTWLGSNVTYSVVVSSSTTPSYLWRLNGTNVVNGPNIIGATSSNLTILNAQYTNVGVYSVAITNSAGGVISSDATLALLGPPQILTQPSNKTVTETGNTTFNVIAGGTNLTYQWRFYATNYLAGETNATYILNNAQAWQAGNYSVVVANGYGSVTSVTAVGTVTLPVGVVGGWGDNGGPASTIGASYRGGYTAVAAGGNHSLGLRTNGTVIAWGENSFGQTNVPPGLSNIVRIAAGYQHSLALRSNGTVVAWGDDFEGQSTVPPGLANVAGISAGAEHSLAWRKDGTVMAWGSNSDGQTDTPLGLKDVVQAAAGFFHNIALKRDGTVVVWGSTNFGEAVIPAGVSNIYAVAAGKGFCLALKTNGTITAWGVNNLGQTNVPAGTFAAAISAGSFHSVILREIGTIAAWGENGSGQTNIPFIFSAGGANLNGIGAGGLHSLALKGSGAPVIMVNPWDKQVSPGENVTFAVSAVGALPLWYTWQLNGNTISSGSNRRFFTCTNTQPEDVGAYSVIISNAAGGASAMATSTVANLTLLGPPVLTSPAFDAAGFHTRLVGPPGIYFLEYSPTLTNWIIGQTNIVPPTGFLNLVDPTATNANRRAYRARLLVP